MPAHLLTPDLVWGQRQNPVSKSVNFRGKRSPKKRKPSYWVIQNRWLSKSVRQMTVEMKTHLKKRKNPNSPTVKKKVHYWSKNRFKCSCQQRKTTSWSKKSRKKAGGSLWKSKLNRSRSMIRWNCGGRICLVRRTPLQQLINRKCYLTTKSSKRKNGYRAPNKNKNLL